MAETESETAAPRVRGRPFRKGRSGNPAGRREGSRNRASLAAEALLDGAVAGLTRKTVAPALAGDPAALLLCLEHMLPRRRARPVNFPLPPINRRADLAAIMRAVLAAVAGGELTLGDARRVARAVNAVLRRIETVALPRRLAMLEAQAAGVDGTGPASGQLQP